MCITLNVVTGDVDIWDAIKNTASALPCDSWWFFFFSHPLSPSTSCFREPHRTAWRQNVVPSRRFKARTDWACQPGRTRWSARHGCSRKCGAFQDLKMLGGSTNGWGSASEFTVTTGTWASSATCHQHTCMNRKLADVLWYNEEMTHSVAVS
ncbi:hypothetical protein M406DRAFT_72189 [Cryphonectria parasitica EP155]|uniref:Uncharacterized protein n=1 Tax=Cryphonectria parasitica (strain ATCC 38755 / EP155) TaxID=660469 RepID=A0A9P5CLF3_CRYP1|nr:uncharacterized protein M406DRAFT_72189 [Cryphonectria parasitica EP155]KAF3762167.1 hypothetical protein M406DRAFT_72189 [Cryphonectria parasitica EP155]